MTCFPLPCRSLGESFPTRSPSGTVHEVWGGQLGANATHYSAGILHLTHVVLKLNAAECVQSSNPSSPASLRSKQEKTKTSHTNQQKKPVCAGSAGVKFIFFIIKITSTIFCFGFSTKIMSYHIEFPMLALGRVNFFFPVGKLFCRLYEKNLRTSVLAGPKEAKDFLSFVAAGAKGI